MHLVVSSLRIEYPKLCLIDFLFVCEQSWGLLAFNKRSQLASLKPLPSCVSAMRASDSAIRALVQRLKLNCEWLIKTVTKSLLHGFRHGHFHRLGADCLPILSLFNKASVCVDFVTVG
jgi:hypothetical protein